MENKTDKKTQPMSFEIPTDLYIELNQTVLNKFGRVHGYLKVAIKEGIRLWITSQKTGEVDCSVKN